MDESGQSTKFIYLPECLYADLLSAIDVIYNGKVELAVDQLPGFHRVLRMLQVKMDRQVLSPTLTPSKASASRLSGAVTPQNNDVTADQSKGSNHADTDDASFKAAKSSTPIKKQEDSIMPDDDIDESMEDAQDPIK